jgi:hypothetical protein
MQLRDSSRFLLDFMLLLLLLLLVACCCRFRSRRPIHMD